MLQLSILTIAGLLGALAGWTAGAYAATHTGIESALTHVPLAGATLSSLGVREIGATIGLVAGIAVAGLLPGRSGRAGPTCGIAAAIVAGGLLYGGSQAGGALFDTLGFNPLAPAFQFEIRLPAGSDIPARREDIQIELHTDRNQIVAALQEISTDGDRPILHGSAPLKFRTAERQIVMSLPGQPVHVFRIRLPAQPSPSASFGPWQQVDFIEDASRANRRAEVTSEYAIRYRVD